jgi:hypothetical protein
MIFPRVIAKNLHRKQLVLPGDFQGQLNILLIPFFQWHQTKVDTWLPFLKSLENNLPNIRYYELPTIQSKNVIAQTFINEGMRAGIPDQVARDRTITLFLDKNDFCRSLEITSEEDITIILVDRTGQVFWRNMGGFSSEKGESLVSAIKLNLS